MKISVVNLASVLAEEIHRVVRAVNRQLAEDFAPYWHLHAELRLDEARGKMGDTRTPHSALRGDAILYLADESDAADLTGYHELHHAGVPYGVVQIDVARDLDGFAPLAWSATLSHETIELLADPEVNRLVRGPHPDPAQADKKVFHWMELCDAVQAEHYEIDGIQVSNFVLPSYFVDRAVTAAADDRTHHHDFLARTPLLQPFGIKPGGYVGYWDPEANGNRQYLLPNDALAERRARIRGKAKKARRLDRRKNVERANPNSQSARNLANAEKLDHALDRMQAGHIALQTVAGLDDGTLSKALVAAERQAKRIMADPLGAADATTSEDEMFYAIVRSAIDEAGIVAPSPASGRPDTIAAQLDRRGSIVFNGDLIGRRQYEEADLRWLSIVKSAIHRKHYDLVPWPSDDSWITHPDNARTRFTIAIVGDWGTLDDDSEKVMDRIVAQAPDFTIHLGDVYYAGTHEQETEFVRRWCTGSVGSFTLNSNHEMYSGAIPYFDVALESPSFALQQGHSQFAYQLGNWVLIGLDSAVDSEWPFHARGVLSNLQAEWLARISARARHEGKGIILLSHHEGQDAKSLKHNAFWQRVTSIVAPDFWYWGHIHAGCAFKVQKVDDGSGSERNVRARLVGHGGVPWAPFSQAERARLEWAETNLANDPTEPKRACNGFVLVELDGPTIKETFFDENGVPTGQMALGTLGTNGVV